MSHVVCYFSTIAVKKKSALQHSWLECCIFRGLGRKITYSGIYPLTAGHRLFGLSITTVWKCHQGANGNEILAASNKRMSINMLRRIETGQYYY